MSTGCQPAGARETPDPRKHDEATADLWREHETALWQTRLEMDKVHAAAGDRRNLKARGRPWIMTGEKALAAAPREAREAFRAAKHGAEIILGAIQALENVYCQYLWQRYFLCLSHDGHIHSSERGCPTVRITTQMQWRPDLSGWDVAAVVKTIGPALCSHCFPSAPSDWKSKTLSQIGREATQAQRDAEKAARQAGKDAKKLASEESFRAQYDRNKVCTVAECERRIRMAIEEEAVLLDYRSGEFAREWQGSVEQLAQMISSAEIIAGEMQADSAQARRVLLAREERHPGWGRTQAQLDAIIARARKRHGLGPARGPGSEGQA